MSDVLTFFYYVVNKLTVFLFDIEIFSVPVGTFLIVISIFNIIVGTLLSYVVRGNRSTLSLKSSSIRSGNPAAGGDKK